MEDQKYGGNNPVRRKIFSLCILLFSMVISLMAGYGWANRYRVIRKWNSIVYGDASAAAKTVTISKLYIPDEKKEDAVLRISDVDLENLSDRMRLPSLERMDANESSELMGSLQVLRKIDVLGIDKSCFDYPDAQYKLLYNQVMSELQSLSNENKEVGFDGSLASELNRFMRSNPGNTINVIGKEILVDETVDIPSNIVLNGNGVLLVPAETALNKAVVMNGVENVRLSDIKIDGGFDYGVYVKHSDRYVIENNTVYSMNNRGIVIMGSNRCFALRSNNLEKNLRGGIFMNGNISEGVIEENKIIDNNGAGNLEAGLVFCSVDIKNEDTTENPLENINIYDALESPHELVVYRNSVSDNRSSGCYSHGGYMNYYVQNRIVHNEKEGACLDYGSFGNYVAYNLISENGGRNRMTDEELERDFISSFGRLDDGSSPAKVPGLSLDNAAYNTIYNNLIAHNYGTGVKAVRSAYRNRILCNEVTDNNQGASENFHFFGIELATDMNSDEQLSCLDFTPCYENIIARNTISGNHYAGIFYGVDSYINDSFDNIIMGTSDWGIESLSVKYNSLINNFTDIGNHIEAQ